MRLLFFVSLLCATSLVGWAADNLSDSNPQETARREFQLGHFDAALAALNDAEKRGPLADKDLILRGRIFAEEKKDAEATAAFDAARKAGPANLAGLYQGDMLYREKKWDEARATYETAMKHNDVLIANERYRYALLMIALAQQDEEAARIAFGNISFPTESPAYYYTQAAWAFAHGAKADGEKWIARAEDVFPAKATAWFARPLHEFGWVKNKPALVAD